MKRAKLTSTNPPLSQAGFDCAIVLIRLADSCMRLANVQSDLRAGLGIFRKLAKLKGIPEGASRELLAKLTKRDTRLLEDLLEMDKHLKAALALMGPPR